MSTKSPLQSPRIPISQPTPEPRVGWLGTRTQTAVAVVVAAVATAIAFLLTTAVVLSVVDAGPTGIPGALLLFAGLFAIVTVVTLVSHTSVDTVLAAVRSSR